MPKLLAHVLRLAGLVGLATMLAGAVPGMAQQKSILNQVVQRGTVRIAIIGGSPPFSTITPSGTPQGYDIDVANQLSAALGVKPEFVITDVPGRIVSLQSGKVDLTIASFTKTVERSKVIAFSHPYVVVSLQFLVLANRDDIKTIDDLNKPLMKIAITRGGTAEANVPKVLPNVTPARFDAMNDVLLALKAGQVDALSQDNLYNGQLMGREPNTYKVLPGNTWFPHEEFGIGVPAGDPDWLRVVDVWVDQFNASGDNGRLFKKWFGDHLPPIQAHY